MLCQNCGENEVTFRYTQIINGVKKEMALCDKCAKSLGLDTMDFNMPINFSSFLSDFLNETADTEFIPKFSQKNSILKCENCGMTYNEFIDNGKFGCDNCYEIFGDRLDNVLKNIHGSSEHVGRRSINNTKDKTVNSKSNNEKQNIDKKDLKEEKLEELNMKLKLAIQEERYEDAAKIRDEIKNINNSK